ncbi:MAG: hypothetical protein HGA87_01010 [Desulfobulbaceae bacterium]|nr:hypothetical protein [Desulfobulbaceae bacterium]
MSDVYNSRLALWLRPNRAWTQNAITIGQKTYWSLDSDDPRITTAWRIHEQKHKDQWKKYGIFFLPNYIWQTIVHRSYYENSFEVAARKAEKETTP